MCGRYYRRSDKQRIAEAFHLGTLDDTPLEAAPSYNIAPTTMQPVIRNNRDTGEREIVAMRWGMVPNFAQSLADFKRLLNHQRKGRDSSFKTTMAGSVSSSALPRSRRWFLRMETIG